MPFPMEKNLYGYVSKLTRDVSKKSVLQLIEEDRIQKLEMNPSSAFRNRKANSVIEKNNIITNILEDIKDYKIKRRELKDANRKLGTFLITNCDGCRDDYDLFKDTILLDNNGNKVEKTWANYFLYQDKDYCNNNCVFNNLEGKDKDFVDKYNTYYDNRFKTLTEYNTLGIEYRVALEQKQSLLESFEEMIKTHKETVAILIFKKNDIQWHINIIQLSVIVISTIITIFETSQRFLEQYLNQQILVIFPIVLSSYIGLVLAVGRFFKYDDKNEKIIKLIEKYSFIINKFRQKSDNFENFDFKLKDMKKWEELLDRDEKDNIGDILLKANEEKDLVLTPREAVYYKKKYTKTRLKELIEGKNFKELGDLINKNEYPNMQITKLTQDIILKRNWCKYYCCFMWLCYDRDYVDYNKTVLKNAIFFLKSNDIYDEKDVQDDQDDVLISDRLNNKEKTREEEMNIELKALVETMQKKINTMELEKQREKKIERIRVEEERERHRKEIAKASLRSARINRSPVRSRSPVRRGRGRRGRRGSTTHQEYTDSESDNEEEEEEGKEEKEENLNKFCKNQRVIYKNNGVDIKCRIRRFKWQNNKCIYRLIDDKGIKYFAKEKYLVLDNDKAEMVEPGVTLILKDIDRGEGKTETKTEENTEALQEKYMNEFENEIWNEVKTYPTLIYGLTNIYDEIARDIRNTMTVKHLMLYISDALDMPHTGTTKEFCECIHAKIKSGNGITHDDWLKYFKNAFKTRIIDLNKPGFVDDCVIDISGADQEDISGNDISNNVIIDTSGNNSLV